MSISDPTVFNWKVDDTDPRLVYSGRWFEGGVSQEFNTTTHGTNTAGSKVAFSFFGTLLTEDLQLDTDP